MPKELYQSNRATDSQTAKEIEKFLDKYYTGKIPFVRVTSKALQLQGIDVIFQSATGDDMLVDEKCATDYIGKNLQTFAFELRATSDKKSGYRYDGWFLSNRLNTTHYLLAFINRAKVEKNPKSEDIQEMEIMLINKDKVIAYLKDLGWTTEKLVSKCNAIDSGDTDFGNIEDGFKFSKSKHKIEAPINILIPRAELRIMSLHNDLIHGSKQT
jgi:hypothetical protein